MLLSALLGLAAAGAACVLYGVLVERRWFRLTRYRLDILPAGGPHSVSVLHLSDLHFVRGDRKKARFLGNLPERDLTVLTGDILEEPAAVDAAAEALRGLRGRAGSFFVLGSHDYYAPRPASYLRYFRKRRRHHRGRRGRDRDLVARLEADGWVHLKNERREVALDGEVWEMVGLDDPHIHRNDTRIAVRRAPDRFGLAVVHSPDPAPELVALGYDLVVAGHTHGGQVRLPVVGALVTNSSLPRGLARGLSRLGPGFLHVSPGLGTSRFAPFRFLCRPEATLLELHRAMPGGADQPDEARTDSKTRS